MVSTLSLVDNIEIRFQYKTDSIKINLEILEQEMPICVAITSKGVQCTKKSSNQERCKAHYKSLELFGPNETAQRELKYFHKKEREESLANFTNAEATHPDTTGDRQRIYLANSAIQRAQQYRMMVLLVNQQREHVRLTGVDPDQIARERRRVRDQQNIENRRLLRAALHEQLRHVAAAYNPPPAVVVPAIGPRVLAAFVADPQNVHTTEAVNQTKSIIAKIRLIIVPEGYRWHPTNGSKTPFEIGMECNLSQSAAWQMISQYAQATAIYDIDEGIYGKVLDSVWQYIKNSPDKNDLCVILKTEMEDNVGMCAQGNLSRICNILSGYMEGVGAQESLAEILGRLLPPLLNIPDVYERVRQACIILRDNRVPQSEWDSWMESFIEDEDEDDRELYDMLKEALTV